MHISWNDFFNRPDIKKELAIINKLLDDEKKNNKTVYPIKSNIFKVFETSSLLIVNVISVVFWSKDIF